MPVKRLRIFAGPNGSGKSTLTKIISDLNIHIGVYVNADDIKYSVIKNGYLDFSEFKVHLDLEEIRSQFLVSSWAEKTKDKGFKIYLYFVGLNNPIINVERVKARVKNGGHSVPSDKIINRYERTMNLLMDALRLCDKVYLFDNSHSQPKLIATVVENEIRIEDNIDYIPSWFKMYILDKL